MPSLRTIPSHSRMQERHPGKMGRSASLVMALAAPPAEVLSH